MHQGCFRRWEPMPTAKVRWYLDGIHDDFEGFRLLLRGEHVSSPVIRVAFDVPLLYQVADEGFRLSAADEHSEFDFPHPFYIVDQSSFVADFHRSSSGAYGDWNITHFVVYAADQCVDVLSVSEPVVEFLGQVESRLTPAP